MRKIIFCITLIALLPMALSAQGKKDSDAGQILNRVVLVVGDVAVTDMDMEYARKSVVKMANVRPIRNGVEQAAIDLLIERAILEMEAKNESIIVSDQRIANEIQKKMDLMGLKTEMEFKRMAERETGIPYETWIEEMRYGMIKRQLIQVKISVPQADRAEIEAFYQKNRGRVGNEVQYREIAFFPKNSSIDEEARIQQLANQVYNQVRGSSGAFANLAKTHPENISSLRVYGGLSDFVAVSDIAQSDRILAGMLDNLGPGATSPVFRDERGRYVVIRVESKRPMAFDKIAPMIRDRLYMEKEEKAFTDWLEKRKKEVAIERPGQK